MCNAVLELGKVTEGTLNFGMSFEWNIGANFHLGYAPEGIFNVGLNLVPLVFLLLTAKYKEKNDLTTADN